ncbi:MAG: DUF4153 domain-containing protein [Hyphomicrobiaceae bacterium]
MSQLVDWIAKDGFADAGRVFARFPVSAISAVLLTLFVLFDLHEASAVPAFLRLRLPALLAAGFLWALAVDLFAERAAVSAARWGLAAGGLAVLAALIAWAEAADLSYGMLMAALILLCGLSGYLRGPFRNAEFWQFNHHFWISALVALATSLLFATGVSLIFESLKYLFGIGMPTWLHTKVWTVAFGLVAPLNWLALVPRQLDVPVPEGEQREFTSRVVAMLVRYLLVSLLLVFALILHVYAVKILLEWSLPKGRLGYMVLTFAAVLTITSFLAFPTRNAGGWLLARYWRWWPMLLPIPVVLLFIAVWERISQYGLTDGRYFLVLAGIWLVALVASEVRGAGRRDLRWPVGLLAGLLALAAVGPWGLVGASTRVQASDLAARLGAAGLIKDGRVIDSPRAETVLGIGDRTRVGGAILYLAEQGRLNLLQPLFAGGLDDPFAKSRPSRRPDTVWPFARARAGSRDRELARDIRLRLGLGPSGAGGQVNRFVNFNARQPLVIEVDGARRLIGMLAATKRRGGLPHRTAAGQDAFVVELEAGAVNIVEVSSGRIARFDAGSSEILRASMLATARQGGTRAGGLVRLRPVGGDLDADMLVAGASGRRGDGDTVDLTSVRFWLSIAK